MKILKLIVISTCFLFCATSMAYEGIQFLEISLDQALAKSKEEQKPIFLHATVNWSGYCKRLISKEFSNKELADYYNSKFINVKINMEGPNGLYVADKYEIKSYPTLLYIRPDGTLIGTIKGYNAFDVYLKAAKQIYGESPTPKSDALSAPSLSTFLKWSKLNNSEWKSTMKDLGLKQKIGGYVKEDCLYFYPEESGDMDYVIQKCSGKYIEMQYGAFNNGDATAETEVKSKIETFKNSLKEHYKGKKTIGNFIMDEYKFSKDGTTYSILLLNDTYCAGASSCTRLKIYFRWS